MVTKRRDVIKLHEYKELFNRQLELELEMREIGKHKDIKKKLEAVEGHNESLTIYGKKLLKACIDEYERHLDLELIRVKSGREPIDITILKQLDTKTIAVIATKKIIDGITSVRKLTSFTISLGAQIEDELRSRAFYEHNKAWADKVTKDLEQRTSHYGYKRAKIIQQQAKSGLMWQSWETSTKEHVGATLVKTFINATNLCEIQSGKGRKKNQYHKVIVPTQKTLDTIKSIDDFNEFLNPDFFPTLVKPRDWKPGKSIGGGYICKDVRPIFMVAGHNITTHRNFLKELESYNMPHVIDGMNKIQSTMYKINKGILLVAQTVFGNDDRNRGGLTTTKLHDLPNKPHDINTNKDSLNRWKAAATVVYSENQKLKSKRLAIGKTLWIAEKFKDEKQIGFPTQLDFRSRLYYVPSYLNPQGTDLAKSLLKFAEKKPIGEEGFKWLCIHLANTYGYDKVSLAEREQWALDNKEDILKSADESFQCSFWEKADKPWQFLAACYEFAKVDEHGLGYESDIILNIDGSCNGLQHFSSLFRDEKGGYATNLTDTDNPQDIYQIVCDNVIEKLKKSDNPIAKEWLDIGIDRKSTKRSVMVLPYGGTRWSCVDFIDEYVQERENKGEKLVFKNRQKACLFLAHTVWDSIGSVVVKATEAMDWLKSAAKLVAKKDKPVHWLTPLGFPVRQAYYSQKDLVVRTRMLGRVRIKSATDKICKRSQSSAVSPNFIHSLDATCMFLTVAIAHDAGINSFSMVHDSYGTHACDITKLNKATREAFIELYSNTDPIDDLREQLCSLLTEKEINKLPDLPEKGDLDLYEVRKSKYFFC